MITVLDVVKPNLMKKCVREMNKISENFMFRIIKRGIHKVRTLCHDFVCRQSILIKYYIC